MTDDQPAPTAWAYEAACAALHHHRARAIRAEADADQLATCLAALEGDGCSDRARSALNAHQAAVEARETP